MAFGILQREEHGSSYGAERFGQRATWRVSRESSSIPACKVIREAIAMAGIGSGHSSLPPGRILLVRFLPR